MRTFIAIDLDQQIRDALEEVIARLRQTRADVSWTHREKMHLTLKFLGEIDEALLPSLDTRLTNIAHQTQPFSITLKGLGHFAQRVAWAGCQDEEHHLATFASHLESTLAEIGIPRETRPFAAHLTLGRVRSPRNVKVLLDQLKTSRDEIFGKQTVECFVLYRSTLRPGGSIYEVLHTFVLEA